MPGIIFGLIHIGIAIWCILNKNRYAKFVKWYWYSALPFYRYFKDHPEEYEMLEPFFVYSSLALIVIVGITFLVIGIISIW